MKTFLHVGCGPQNKHGLKGFESADWQEIRLDINPEVKPDIIGITLLTRRPVDVTFEISTTSATMLLNAVPIAMPRARPAGAGLPQFPSSAAASSTAIQRLSVRSERRKS